MRPALLPELPPDFGDYELLEPLVRVEGVGGAQHAHGVAEAATPPSQDDPVQCARHNQP